MKVTKQSREKIAEIAAKYRYNYKDIDELVGMSSGMTAKYMRKERPNWRPTTFVKYSNFINDHIDDSNQAKQELPQEELWDYGASKTKTVSDRIVPRVSVESQYRLIVELQHAAEMIALSADGLAKAINKADMDKVEDCANELNDAIVLMQMI